MSDRRIGWTDSAGMPARIHATADDGETTVCGHRPRGEANWTLSRDVPRKIRGRSNYCAICFAGGRKKSIPWWRD